MIQHGEDMRERIQRECQAAIEAFQERQEELRQDYESQKLEAWEELEEEIKESWREAARLEGKEWDYLIGRVG